MYIIVRPVKVFTPQRMSMVVIFAIHNAEVFCVVASILFDTHSFWWEGMNRFAHLPIIFVHRVEIVILCFAVRRRFINVLKHVGVLPLSTRLIKILFEVEVWFIVIFTWHYMEVVVPLIMFPWINISVSRFLDGVAKCLIKNASGTALKTWWRILGNVFFTLD